MIHIECTLPCIACNCTFVHRHAASISDLSIQLKKKEQEIAITNGNDHRRQSTPKKKKRVPIVIEHSSSRQQMRITLFMFERGQQHGLVFMPSKN